MLNATTAAMPSSKDLVIDSGAVGPGAALDNLFSSAMASGLATGGRIPGRTQVPKALIFAKDDSHAEDIVEIVREEFGKGNDICKKITYRTQENPDSLIKSFANSYDPRISCNG